MTGTWIGPTGAGAGGEETFLEEVAGGVRVWLEPGIQAATRLTARAEPVTSPGSRLPK
jgi:hypothetical protein